eukprot:2691312-Heterocapsa_arctica.AAC.1
MGNYDLTCLRMKKAPDGYDYPIVDDNTAFNQFLDNDRSQLVSFRKGVRWALLSAMKIWEPERWSGLADLNDSDAKWICELHYHQVRCGLHGALPAVAYKLAIDALADSLDPTLADAKKPKRLPAETAKRNADRERINRLLGSRPLPSAETRLFKGLIA